MNRTLAPNNSLELTGDKAAYAAGYGYQTALQSMNRGDPRLLSSGPRMPEEAALAQRRP